MPREAPELLNPLQHKFRRVSSPMGIRRDPFTGKPRLHAGIDLPAAVGTPVYAALGGTVTHTGYRKGYGPTVDIAHPAGWKTRYAHLSRLRVHTGQSVRQGEPVGESGNIGRSTGPHLHFELRDGNRPVDPLPHIGREPRATQTRAFERAARTILDHKGNTASGCRTYRGLSYNISAQAGSLSVTALGERGEIFKIKDGHTEKNRLSHRDVAIFGDVERQLRIAPLQQARAAQPVSLASGFSERVQAVTRHSTEIYPVASTAGKQQPPPGRKRQMTLD